ncbi:N-6 DNA methylase [Legionella pneumophila]|nr:N-6 DNA methylase [Legionella pneumophila]MDI9844126.1 N-6 DNA methylase [Legionella pneumophila]
MKNVSQHTEWLSMIEISGPFLALPVLEKIFPQGLESLDTSIKRRIRSAYEEWCDAVEENDPQLTDLHRAWVEIVLKEMLEYEDSVLDDALDQFIYNSPDCAGQIKPDFVLRGNDDKNPMLFISIVPAGTDLEKVNVEDGWPVPLLERMSLLCKDKGVSIGLITNGERWMLVSILPNGTSSHASWYARLWFQEPMTLKAFKSLLSVRRWFGAKEENLPAMIKHSLSYSEEITDTLGKQVKRAVEVLIQSLDKADQDRNRELLRNVSTTELYEAGLTVMMRLVFILCAEERGLMLLGDSRYDQNYAINTLRGQLTEDAERYGHEILERRHDAWTRILAVFRAIYGGIEHESLRMPALGGSLFDPDRFPFLEGRTKGTHWQDTMTLPLPIDNRTVLLLLEALQILEQRNGAILLSYKSLDVEQIGHVYEGLLEYAVHRLSEDTLGLIGSSKANNPNISLNKLETESLKGWDALVSLIESETHRSKSGISNALSKDVDENTFNKIVKIANGDMLLITRLKPFAFLLREDAWGNFIFYREGSFVVSSGDGRLETGAHYTPKSLTESIVETTLEPLVYIGPAEDKQRKEWRLKSSLELLRLKICDPAMGSGAFLVQVCRWISERIVESWGIEEALGKFITVDGIPKESAGRAELMPNSLDERLLIARRLVAEKCLYGVDLNPLAVELAKLSIWLITLSKGRPFGFLDHNFRSGDSLLGLYKLEQLMTFSWNPEKKNICSTNFEAAIKEAIVLRKQLRGTSIRDIRDIEYMEKLDKLARQKLKYVKIIADTITEEALKSGGNPQALDKAISNLATLPTAYIEGDKEIGRQIVENERVVLSKNLELVNPPYKPFHWVLEFPEVFESGGFDAIITNPPWGATLNTSLNKLWKDQYDHLLMRMIDSFHLFILRALELTNNDQKATIGLILPDVILYQNYSSLLRKHLLRYTNLLAISNLKNSVFKKVNRPSCVIIFSKERTPNHHAKVYDWQSCRERGFKDENSKCQLSQESLIEFPGHIIPTSNLKNYMNVAEILERIKTRLSDFLDSDGIQRGVSADNKDVFVVSEEIATRECLESSYLTPVVTGGIHLSQFYIQSKLPFLIYTTRDTNVSDIPHIIKRINQFSSRITCAEVKNKKHPIYALHRPRKQQIFTKKLKLLGVITADRPIVSVDENQLFSMDGTFVFAPKENINPYYLAGVLNSEFMAKIYRVFSLEEGREMAQVKLNVLQQLPIIGDGQGNNDISKVISEITKLSKELHITYDPTLKNEKMSSINVLVEKLYYLATGILD